MKEIKKFLPEIGQELNNILSYWKTKMVDGANGGFIGRIDGFNQAHPAAEKGIILNARILWSFSAAYMHSQNADDASYARRAYEAVMQFRDETFGGVYWKLDNRSQPVDAKKQVYAQAFALYALSEYFKVVRDDEVLQQAVELYDLIEKHSYDPEKGGYLEAFDRKWNLLEDLRLSDKDANEKKTMNTHLHVLEAYANLYRVWPDERLKSQLAGLIGIFTHKIIDHKTNHLRLFFDEDWNLKSNSYSYGHDIEAAWLMADAAEATGDQPLIAKMNDAALRIYETTLQEGLDLDGGLFNEGKDGKATDTDKHWWPQAEAMVGFIHGYQLNGDQRFLDAAFRVWRFIKAAIIDKEHGEWFFRVNRSWTPYVEEDKAGFWKCPYHNSRGCLEVLKRLNS